jgi:TRAP-type uncharacterized transport system substrate-binding protein
MDMNDRRITFGGAGVPGVGTRATTLGEILARALAPYDYQVEIDALAFAEGSPRLVANGGVTLGSTNPFQAHWAYEGTFNFAKHGPSPNLRLIAYIEHPSWLGIAVRHESWIADLHEIRERQLPVRVVSGGPGPVVNHIWDYYGLQPKRIESWGGKIHPMKPVYEPGTGRQVLNESWVRTGAFDLIVHTINAGYSPTMSCWQDATWLHNMRFIPLPEDLIHSICSEITGEPGFIPHGLYRGVDRNTPSVSLPGQAIIGRDDLPDEFVYLVARSLDEGRHLFRETHLPFSYDSKTVAKDVGLPLHAGATRYYAEMGYLAPLAV